MYWCNNSTYYQLIIQATSICCCPRTQSATAYAESDAEFKREDSYKLMKQRTHTTDTAAAAALNLEDMCIVVSEVDASGSMQHCSSSADHSSCKCT